MVKDILSSHFLIHDAEITALEGYASENYKISVGGRNFVLKLYDYDSRLFELLKAESALLQKLAQAKPGFISAPQQKLNGEFVFLNENGDKIVRLLSFIEGEMLANVEHTKELFKSFGKFLAEINLEMLEFRASPVEARRMTWDLQNYQSNRELIPLINDPQDRKIVEYFFLQNRERVEPEIGNLRKSVIHGDVNDWNVLVKSGEISGIIDFGDICYTPLVNELAIAITYGILSKDDPIEWALPIIEGYHKVLRLEEKEIEMLYWLIATRLCISVCHSAKSRNESPKSDYHFVSEKAAWELLRKWIRLNPVFVEDEFRKSAGFVSKIVESTAADLEKRDLHTSKALSLQFSKPIKMVGAAFQYMFDAQGKTYLDCYNNIPQVGHCHPRVVEAGQKAMARLNTNTRYLNDVYNEYAESLLAKFPEKLNKVIFVNSGSAASDLAIRLALNHSKNRGIGVMEHGYHGNTRLGIDVSHYKYGRKGGSGKSNSVIEAELPDIYKGRYTQNDTNSGRKYAKDFITRINESGLPVGAFVAEPIVGCGGQVPLAKGFLKSVYPFIRIQGGVCISDEVQTGFGRLGKYFWGFEMHEVVPDVVILGKPMGNGHPIGAVVTTDEIAASFENGMEFFSSFGGNPVSCAIGQSVLDVLNDEQLPQNAAEVGEYLLVLLKILVEKYEVCGDARGEGLFLGLELVEDKLTKLPNADLASFLQNKLRDNGILVGTDGPFNSVIKIKPPICFNKENAVELYENLDNEIIKL
jgi:ethanolamine-phosphate phospho-lyase